MLKLELSASNKPMLRIRQAPASALQSLPSRNASTLSRFQHRCRHLSDSRCFPWAHPRVLIMRKTSVGVFSSHLEGALGEGGRGRPQVSEGCQMMSASFRP